MALRGLPQGVSQLADPLLGDVCHLPGGHGRLSVADGAEAGQVLQAVHESGDGAHGVGVVVEQATAPCPDVEEESLGEVGEGVVVAHGPQDA